MASALPCGAVCDLASSQAAPSFPRGPCPMSCAACKLRPMRNEDYHAVFQASPDGILVVDSEGHIRDVNPMAERLFGYTRDELLDGGVDVLVPPAARARHAGHRNAFVADPHSRAMGIGMELTARRRDGSEFPVEISLSPWQSGAERLVIATVRDVTERTRLREYGSASLRASEDERKRIARELHDDTAQRLATLLVRLRLLQRRSGQDIADGLAEFRGEIEASAESVRRLARGLRPPELEDVGLLAALRAHARQLKEGTGLAVEVDGDAVDDLLDADGRLVLYRIIQEALSNVVRHSGAERAIVTIDREPDRVVARVADQGSGFAPGTISSPGGGLGLLGMKERAHGMGGSVDVKSEPGRGTEVVAALPVRRAATERPA